MTDYSKKVHGKHTLCCSLEGEPPKYETQFRMMFDSDGYFWTETTTRYPSDTMTPMREWHRLDIGLFSVSSNGFYRTFDLDTVHYLFAEGGKAAVLLDRIADGFGEKWDGSNIVGVLTEDAQEARDEFEQLMSDELFVDEDDEAYWADFEAEHGDADPRSV